MPEKNPHSITVWETTKDEAGLVAVGCVLGCAVGVGGGYIVSQAAGTPLTPSLIVGGGIGTAVGGGTAIYAAHRIKEARAQSAFYADDAIEEAISTATKKRPMKRKGGPEQIAKMVGDGVAEALKDAHLGEQVGEAIGDKLEVLPEQIGEALADKLEAMIPQA